MLAILTAPAAAVAAEHCDEPAGRVVAADITVEVAAGVGWRLVRLGEILCVGDVLRVGDADRAVVLLEGGAAVQLARNTTVRIVAAAPQGRTLLRLLSGIVRLFARRPQALEVDTPFANAAVEGTEFTVQVEAAATRVTVLEGRVRVSNPQGALLLTEASSAIAAAGKAPEIELRIRPRDAVQWALYYPPLGEAALPPNAPAPLREAARLAAMGERAQAAARLDAVPVEARDAAYETLRAELLLSQGRPDSALAALGAALERQPDDADALALRAIVAVARNDKEQALADARRAVDRAPRNARAWLALSYAAQAAFDLPLAQESLEAATVAEPDNALAWARLAEAQLMQGDVRSATRSAARAVALDPQDARAWSVQGFVQLARLDAAAAKDAFARSLALASFNPLSQLGTGLADIRQGDLAAGREQIELAVALDPDSATLRSYLGKAYLEERRGEIAGDELATAKALDPNDPTPWLLDAVREQRANRPIPALRQLEGAFARNDGRAVYRSRLLLEQDRASSGVALARIYDDLGLERLATVEASRSLAADPASAAAHRFLADVYAGRPRTVIAEASELLQAQLLSPPSLNPVQPQRLATGRNPVLTEEPGLAGFDPWAPLFARSGLRADGTVQYGSYETAAAQGVATAMAGRTSLSVGQAHYETDGFRENFDLEDDSTNILLVTQPRYDFTLQAEYLRRTTHFGDRQLYLDPDKDFDPTRRRDVVQDVLRLGAHWHPWIGTNLLLSGLLLDREASTEETALEFDPPETSRTDGKRNAGQLEGQLIQRFNRGSLLTGWGYAGADGEDRESRLIDGEEEKDPPDDRDIRAGYAFAQWQQPLGARADLFTRLGYDSVVNERNRRWRNRTPTPGLGLELRPAQGLDVRASLSRTLKRPILVNQTLQPTQLASFNLLYDDPDGTISDQAALGFTYEPMPGLRVGADLIYRDLSWPILTSTSQRTESGRETTGSLFASKLLGDRLALNTQLIGERFTLRPHDVRDRGPTEVANLFWPTSLAYFHPSGWYAQGRLTLVRQEVERYVRRLQNDDQQSSTHSGSLVDAEIGFRLPDGRGQVALQVFNLLDQRLAFQDDSYRTSSDLRTASESGPRFVPDRTVLVTLSLRF